MSIFSDLNNLTDLSMDARTATLLGYTRESIALGLSHMRKIEFSSIYEQLACRELKQYSDHRQCRDVLRRLQVV